MGRSGWLFFNDEELEIIKDIAKIHKTDVDTVKIAYAEMVKKLDEVKD